MVKRWVTVGVVLVVVAMFASSGWSQQRQRGRGFGSMGLEQQGRYISAVLLLSEEASVKVLAVYEEEGRKYSEAMQEIFQSAGGDREAMRAKFQEEREKSAERIKAALKKDILSEGQIGDIEPILMGSFGFRGASQDPYLLALASLTLAEDQRDRLVKLNVPYVKSAQSLARPGRDATEAERTEWQDKIRKLGEDYQKGVKGVLTDEQEEKWEEEAGKIQEQMEKEREERRQRMRQR